MQEGRAYAQRGRPQYAEDKFKKILASDQPDILSKLTARFELFSMYADNFPRNFEVLEKIDAKRRQLGRSSYILYLEEESKKFIALLDRQRDTPEKKLLQADLYFTLGCLFGNYIRYHLETKEERNGEEVERYKIKEINCFKKAVDYDSHNVDFLIHRAVAYAAAQDVENCKPDLRSAIENALEYPIYLALVDEKRLSGLFEELNEPIPPEVESTIKEWAFL